MDHALVGANERFKSLRIAIPALQHPDFRHPCRSYGIILSHRTIGDDKSFEFFRG